MVYRGRFRADDNCLNADSPKSRLLMTDSVGTFRFGRETGSACGGSARESNPPSDRKLPEHQS